MGEHRGMSRWIDVDFTPRSERRFAKAHWTAGVKAGCCESGGKGLHADRFGEGVWNIWAYEESYPAVRFCLWCGYELPDAEWLKEELKQHPHYGRFDLGR